MLMRELPGRVSTLQHRRKYGVDFEIKVDTQRTSPRCVYGRRDVAYTSPSPAPSVMIDIPQLLENSKTIAVVGLSPRETRTSHKIAKYLQKAGYRIVPINPHRDELLGEVSYPTVDAVPDEVQIDIVDIFRRPQFTADVVRDVVRRKERTGDAPVVWTQIGVSSSEAEQLAGEAGLDYVRNRCTLVEHSRLER